jgi:hypothetical protein
MMTSLALELLVALHIADLHREADRVSVAAQLEPRASPMGTWVRIVLRRLASTRGPQVSSDDIPAWPTLENYPYGPPAEW